MNPPKAQEGLWPDGSSGAIKANFCKGCRLVEGDPQPLSKCSGADFEAVQVLPASLAAGLAEALEECIQLASEGWEYASPYFRAKWECEKDIAKAQAALDSYRARMGDVSDHD